MRATNGRPYSLVGSAGYIVGATIGRPLLRFSRQSVTVSAQFNLLPLFVALCPSRRASAFPLRGRWVGEAEPDEVFITLQKDFNSPHQSGCA